MAQRPHHLRFLLLSFATILYQSKSLVLNCNDPYTCARNSYRCSDEICEINCNTDYACENTYFRCDDSYLHGECQVNCAGGDGCEAMVVTSFRDTNIVCSGSDSCDKMNIWIHGTYPEDKINATLTSIGSYTNGFDLTCEGDGIQECFLDCRDNKHYYSCIGVQFSCYTRGICRFKCENSDACCGCTMWDVFSSTTYKNSLHCYEGYDNCIQMDPGGCSESYGCIAKYLEPTQEPTTAPTSEPTSSPTSIPTSSPSEITSNPTVAPTAAPTTLPSSSPTYDGETANPSNQPTKSQTQSPTKTPTLYPTLIPSSDPTITPSNNPTTDPVVSPTVRPTLAASPTKDPAQASCISIVESIENLNGVTTDDFTSDAKLQLYVMNTTKLVIYEAFKTSHIYDMETLCQDFWRCFFLQLIKIRGNTLFDIDICAWSQPVHHAMSKKVELNAEEMGAFMLKGLRWYLEDGPAYAGYDDVVISDATRVMFNIVTPSPTGNAQVIVETTDIEDNLMSSRGSNSSKGKRTALGVVIAVIFVCVCLLIVAWFWYGKHTKIKHELFETQQRVVDLEALTGIEGDGVELDNVVPDEEGEGAPNTGGMTVSMRMTNDAQQEQQDVQSDSNRDDEEASITQPGSVVGGSAHAIIGARISIPELPELKDDEKDSLSSDDDDEMNALYIKKESSEELYATPGTKTGGDQEHITVSGDMDENEKV